MMEAAIWLVLLVSTGVGGLWLSAKHWQGWCIYAANEVLWFAYALRTADPALAIMAVIWFGVGVRNFVVTRHAKPERERRRIEMSPEQMTAIMDSAAHIAKNHNCTFTEAFAIIDKTMQWEV